MRHVSRDAGHHWGWLGDETTGLVIALAGGARRCYAGSGSDGVFEAAVHGDNRDGVRLRFDAVVSALAGYAPVVVFGNGTRPAELDALVAAGAADYIGLPDGNFPAAAEAVERRLKQSREVETHVQAAQNEKQRAEGCRGVDDFGQLLRHELNNPLTGILGNAELLLSEVRRKNDGKLPQGAQARLETIRLRETVRRLSQEWETNQEASSSPK